MGAVLSQDRASKQNDEESSNNIPQSSDAKALATQSTTKVPLPHNSEDLSIHVDSEVDRSSTKKLQEQLSTGVCLNQNRKGTSISQRHWVEKESNGNGFILFAQDLSITWAEDDHFWHWFLLRESSDRSQAVAELLNACWLEVHGRFEIANLSPGQLYEVVFVVKLKDSAYGWEVPVNLRLTLPDGSRQEHKENLMEKPKEKWIEIPAGEFKSSGGKVGEIEFSLYEYDGGEWKRGLLIKGVRIRPKA